MCLLVECGAAFTSKLEGMFKDMELSKDIMIQFKQVFKLKSKINLCSICYTECHMCFTVYTEPE